MECTCEHIVASHELRDGKNFKEVVIECADCDKELFRDKYNYKDIQANYRYVNENKDKIKSLVDMTCDNLNEIYNIPSGFDIQL